MLMKNRIPGNLDNTGYCNVVEYFSENTPKPNHLSRCVSHGVILLQCLSDGQYSASLFTIKERIFKKDTLYSDKPFLYNDSCPMTILVVLMLK